MLRECRHLKWSEYGMSLMTWLVSSSSCAPAHTCARGGNAVCFRDALRLAGAASSFSPPNPSSPSRAPNLGGAHPEALRLVAHGLRGADARLDGGDELQVAHQADLRQWEQGMAWHGRWAGGPRRDEVGSWCERLQAFAPHSKPYAARPHLEVALPLAGPDGGVAPGGVELHVPVAVVGQEAAPKLERVAGQVEALRGRGRGGGAHGASGARGPAGGAPPDATPRRQQQRQQQLQPFADKAVAAAAHRHDVQLWVHRRRRLGGGPKLRLHLALALRVRERHEFVPGGGRAEEVGVWGSRRVASQGGKPDLEEAPTYKQARRAALGGLT